MVSQLECTVCKAAFKNLNTPNIDDDIPYYVKFDRMQDRIGIHCPICNSLTYFSVYKEQRCSNDKN